ncbi:MAG: hypothetical protein FWH48_03600 [Oscillospiraceae bacterium]|nr:hypothetical protein [Oscillospiraceae bacterium]
MKKIICIVAALLLAAGLFACDSEKPAGDWKAPMEKFFTQFAVATDDADGANVPVKYRFLDLDGDDVPEIIISYGLPESELTYDKVYKLYGDVDVYVKIAEDSKLLAFYTNQEGKLVVAKRSGYMVDSIYFAEIADKKLSFNSYVDSRGSDSYNGVKYDSLPELYSDMDIWSALDLDDTLSEIAEIDCSEVVNAAKNPSYKWENGLIVRSGD